jgi:hypothetical protein
MRCSSATTSPEFFSIGIVAQHELILWPLESHFLALLIDVGFADVVDQFTVGLITNGYPIHPQFITVLDGLPDEFGNAHDWKRPTYSASHIRASHLAVEDVDTALSRHETDSQVDELVCRSPFHEHPEELADALDLHDSRPVYSYPASSSPTG